VFSLKLFRSQRFCYAKQGLEACTAGLSLYYKGCAEFEGETGAEKMLNEGSHFSPSRVRKIQTGRFPLVTCLIWRGICLQHTRLTDREKKSLNPKSFFDFLLSGQRSYNKKEFIRR
jgi:hypothetical protein